MHESAIPLPLATERRARACADARRGAETSILAEVTGNSTRASAYPRSYLPLARVRASRKTESYPSGVANKGGDTALGPDLPRRFGQLPGLVVSDDFDAPLPQTEEALWEAPEPSAHTDFDAVEKDPRKSLLESEADITTGQILDG